MLRNFIIVAAVVLCSVASKARDNGQYADVDPEIKTWVEGLVDSHGIGCCATADGFRPEEVEWDTADSAYRVRLAGNWFKVPEEAVIKSPNKLGFAMVWYYTTYNNTVTIRCFLPGSGA